MRSKNNAAKAIPSKKEDIISQAYASFYEHGFHATGVDKALGKSGLSKRTVYKYFRSKEELVAATIKYYQQITFATVLHECEKRAKTPLQKILTIFDLKAEAIAKGDYSGCFAINAKIEYEGKDKGIEEACAIFVSNLEGFILSCCKEAKIKEPKSSARQILILLEGAIVLGQAKRDAGVVKTAKDMAEKLLS